MLSFDHNTSKRYQKVPKCTILRVWSGGIVTPSDHYALCVDKNFEIFDTLQGPVQLFARIHMHK